ncbi:unnamed protein product [Closterium sp. NIES-53]
MPIEPLRIKEPPTEAVGISKATDRRVKTPLEALRVKKPPAESVRVRERDCSEDTPPIFLLSSLFYHPQLPAVYQLFEEAGTDLGQGLTQKAVREETRRSMSLAVAKAIARVSGGLYVVAASKGSSRGAMIASWVSQVRAVCGCEGGGECASACVVS